MSERNSKIPAPPATSAVTPADVDVQHGAIGNGPGYSGQEYDADDFASDRALKASAEVEGGEPPRAGIDLPPENGRRAFFDEATGAVHGSGSGAGGGNPGEDFASDAAAGDGYPQTGRASRRNDQGTADRG